MQWFKEKPGIAWGRTSAITPHQRRIDLHARLNFEVVKRPNIHPLPRDLNIISDNSYFTFHTDTEAILSDKVGSDYEVVQNTEVFIFFDGYYGGQHGATLPPGDTRSKLPMRTTTLLLLPVKAVLTASSSGNLP